FRPSRGRFLVISSGGAPMRSATRNHARAALTWIFRSLMFVGIATPARASDFVYVTVKNTTGVYAADLHVPFTGAGSSVIVDPATVYAPGCPTPTVPSNPPTLSPVADIEWGAGCVPPGSSI